MCTLLFLILLIAIIPLLHSHSFIKFIFSVNTYGNAILFFFFVGSGCLSSKAQSGFTAISENSDRSAYCYGQPFFRQYQGELSVSESVAQSYLLTDTVLVEICEHDSYNDYEIEYSDTSRAGFYEVRRYTHSGNYHYDSLFIHQLYIHSSYQLTDTLLLFSDDMRGYVAGENVFNGYSQFGCDSSIKVMVYKITCPADYTGIAQYGEEEIALNHWTTPQVVPLSSTLSISNNQNRLIRIGEREQVVWYIIHHNDTAQCVQNVHIAFPPCGESYTATDGDGHIYSTIRIGGNCWLRKNLQTKHYAQDGRLITVAKVCISEMFPDTTSNLANFGRLYSWYSAVGIRENSNDVPISNSDGEIQGICPIGWHIPSMNELSTLNLCTAISLKNNTLWIGDADNNSNFSASPAGSYNSIKERYEYIRAHTFLWSSEEQTTTTAYNGTLAYYCNQSLMENSCNKNDGCSVRCVKD